MTVTQMKTTIELEWEELLTEGRTARKYGVPGIGSRQIADVERKLERVVRSNVKVCEQLRVCSEIISDAENLDCH